MREYRCQQCHKIFRNYISDKSKYCSKICKDIGISVNHRHICGYCQKEFITKKKTSKYCSFSCAGKVNVTLVKNHRGNTNSGALHWNWKGGRKVTGSLYRQIKIDDKWLYEHRVIAEEYLGRKLLPREQVHHINMNHMDNRIENLIVVTDSWHTKLHHIMRKKSWQNS